MHLKQMRLTKKPANVIPICIVAKNLLGFLTFYLFVQPFYFHPLTSFPIFASFKDINVISLAAKYAFTNINSINITICIFVIFLSLRIYYSSLFCYTHILLYIFKNFNGYYIFLLCSLVFIKIII